MLAAEEFAVGGSRYLCIPEVSSHIIGAMAKLKSHNLVHFLLLDLQSWYLSLLGSIPSGLDTVV